MNTKDEKYHNHRLRIDVPVITASCLIFTENVAVNILKTLGATYEIRNVECDYSANGMDCRIL